MLIPLIAIAWLAVALVVFVLCRMAAGGDAAANGDWVAVGERGLQVFPGLTVFDRGDQNELRRAALRRLAAPRLPRRRGHTPAPAPFRRSRSGV